MATFRKRSGKWQARIQRFGLPDMSKTFVSKSDAETWAITVESDFARGCFISRSEADKMSFGDILKRYRNEISPQKRSGGRNEVICINRFLREDRRYCGFKASSLSGMLLAEWRDKRLQEVSGSTVNRELNILSHAINVARKEWGINIQNPVECIQRPRHNKPRDRRLLGGELEHLLNELELTERCENGTFVTGGTHNPWLKPIVLFAIETGMRQSEILSLTWCKVDLAKQLATLDETKNGSKRIVPLSKAAIANLCSIPRSIDGRVFATSAASLKHGFSRAVERAKLNDIHFHDLRHEATSRLFEKGLNVVEVASITGHKTLAMLQRYTHLRPELLLQRLG